MLWMVVQQSLGEARKSVARMSIIPWIARGMTPLPLVCLLGTQRGEARKILSTTL
jgi:hypothetical protein